MENKKDLKKKPSMFSKKKDKDKKESKETKAETAKPEDEISDEKLKELFEKFLEDVNIPEQSRAGLRSKDRDFKLKMIKSNQKISEHNGPEHCIELLSQFTTGNLSDDKKAKYLDEIRIFIQNSPVSAIKIFDNEENKGLDKLITVITTVRDKPELMGLCLRALRAFGNFYYGLFALLDNHTALMYIAYCLKTENPSNMSIAVEILTIIGFYSQKGHKNVLQALYDASRLRNVARFVPIIEGVKAFQPELENEQDNLSLSCIHFINILTNPKFATGDAPLDTYFRMHLRREFVNIGLLQIYDEINRDSRLKSLQDAISKFFDEFESDESEYMEDMTKLIRSFGDANDIFRLINRSLPEPVSKYFRSILGSLMIIKDDPLREDIYRFIDCIVSEIVLQTDEDFNPDPSLTQFSNEKLSKLYNTQDYKEEIKNLEKENENNSIKISELHILVDKLRNENKKLSDHQESAVSKAKENLNLKKIGTSTSFTQTESSIPMTCANGYPPPKRPDSIPTPDIPTQAVSRPPPPPGGPPPPPGGGPPPPPGGGPPPPPGGGPPPPPGGGPPPPPGGGPPPPPGGGPPPPPGGGPPPPPGGGPPPPPGGGPPLPPGGGPPRPPGGMPPPPPCGLPPPGQAPAQPDVFSKYHIVRKKYDTKSNPKEAVKLKQANWKKINTKNVTEKSVWTAIEDDSLPEEVIQLCRQNFASKPPVVKQTTAAETSAPKSVGKVAQVLDGKTAQNLSILIASMKMDPDKLRNAVLSTNTGILTMSSIEQLLKALPDADTLSRIGALNRDELVDVEKLCHALSSIKKLTARLESILFMLRFPDRVNDLKTELHASQQALQEIRTSTKFVIVLKTILGLGNLMNSGGRNEQSIGFEIEFLTKLSNTKDATNQRTFVHYLAEIIESRHFPVQQLRDQLQMVVKARTISLDNVTTNYNSLKKEFQSLCTLLKGMKSQGDGDLFLEKLKPFSDEAQEQLEVVSKFLDNVGDAYKDVCEYLVLDGKNYSMEQLFGDISQFLEQLQAAEIDNEKRRLKEEREEKMRAEKERKLKEKEAAAIANKKAEEGGVATGVGGGGGGSEDGCVMDNLLQMLKTGNAYGGGDKYVRAGRQGGARQGGARRQMQTGRTREIPALG